MLYLGGKFYDCFGRERSFVEEGIFYNFDNGEKYFRFEIENKIFNFNAYETTRILNKIELKRRKEHCHENNKQILLV